MESNPPDASDPSRSIRAPANERVGADSSSETLFKVLFHEGEEVGLATKGQTGRLVLSSDALCIDARAPCVVSYELMQSVVLFRMHGVGSVITVTHTNGTLFLTVVRFSLFGLFALVNRNATLSLAEDLKRRIPHGPFG